MQPPQIPNRERALGLDCLKWLLALMVVFIHCEYSSSVLLDPLMRVSVPLFFMISGYFYADVCAKGGQVRQIRKIVRLFLSSLLFYFLWETLRSLHAGELASYLTGFVSIKFWIKFFCFNSTAGMGYHLWYLQAVAYVLIILALTGRKLDRKKLYPLIPLLLVCNLLLGMYSNLLTGRILSVFYSRNFLFSALPFFLLGDFLRQHKFTAKNWVLIAALCFFTAVSYLEYALLRHANYLVNKDCSLGTVFQAICIFVLVVNNEHRFSGKFLQKMAAASALTTGIYILHPMVIQILEAATAPIAWLAALYHHIGPLVVFAVTLALVWCFHAVAGRFKKKTA